MSVLAGPSAAAGKPRDLRSGGRAPERGFLRALPLPPGSFCDAWARDPARFTELLPNPFGPGALDGLGAAAPRNPERRQRTAAALLETNRAWGGDRRALADAGSLAESGTLTVVTGQQPGLFGGPLYSLVKAMSAVAAARRLEAETGRPSAAVFWIEGDDHDFEEIRKTWVLDRAAVPHPLRYEPAGERPGLPAFRRILDDSIGELLARLKTVLPPTDFTRETLAALADAYAPGRSFAEAFGRFLLHLTRGTGLLVMDPTTPALKRLSFPVYRAALRYESEGRRRIAGRTRRIEAAGFRAQAVPEGYGVFCTGPNGVRERVKTPPGTDPTADLSGCAERLSAAVLLRPLVQDYLLGTAAYVGGPSEIAYHAQIGDLYRLHALPRPLVIPRHQVSVLGASQLRVLDRDGIGLDELSAGDESALNRRAADPAAAAALDEARTAVESHLLEVERTVGALDGSLSAAARRALGKMLAILSDLEAKSLRAAKRRDEERRQRFLRARNALFPGGAPQERRLSPLVFVNRCGPDFAGRLLAALEHPDADRRARNLLLL